MWAEFLITSFIVVLTPGTGVLYTIGAGLARGKAASIAAAAGCTFGIIPHLLAATMGLAALLHSSALLFQSVKWAGIAYLLYLAWSILKDDGPMAFDAKTDNSSLAKVALTGFLINILNPKLSIFFLAFLPQFLPPETSTPVMHMLSLGGIFMVMTFVVFIAYGAFAAKIRHHIQQKPSFLAWTKRSFAAAFLLLGARLGMEGS